MMTHTTVCLAMLAGLFFSFIAMAAEPAPQRLQAGQHCEITTKVKRAGWERTTTTYLGTVVEANKDTVILENVSEMGRVERTTPVLGQLPYLNRLFKNVGVGRAHLGERRVTVAQTDIATVRTVPAKEFAEQTGYAKADFMERAPAGP